MSPKAHGSGLHFFGILNGSGTLCTAQDEETMVNHKSRQAAWICCLGVACQAPTPDPLEGHVPPSFANHGMSAEATTSAPAEDSTWSPQEGLQVLLQRAVLESPEVITAYQDWMAAVEQEPQARALPDPWLNLRGYVASVETRSGPMDGQIGLTQMLPWPGKLDAAGAVAAARAEAARWRIEEERLRVRSAFLGHWTEMTYLQEAIAITEAQVVLLQYIEDVSLRLYESSRATQADVLRAQVERLQMQDRSATLREKTHALLPEMERLLGASMDTHGTWEEVPLPQAPTLASRDAVAALFASRSPAMVRLQHSWQAADAGRRVASLEDRPDLALGADWTWIGQGNVTSPDAGDDAFSISLSVELPLQKSRIAATRREALAVQKRVLAEIASTRWDLTARLDIAWSDFHDATRRVTLYRSQLLPLGEQTYETTMAAYQAGQSDFQDMLDAARVVLDFRLSAVRAQADAHLAFAALNGLLPHDLLLAETTER